MSISKLFLASSDTFNIRWLVSIKLGSIIDCDNDITSVKYRLASILQGTESHEIPTEDIVYTNNDYDDGIWLREYGYKEFRQIKPECYKISGYTVYRSGKTEWHKLDNTEVN